MMPEQGMTLPALSRGFFDSTVQEIDHAANAYLYEAERNSIDISSFLRIAEIMNSGSYRDIIPLLKMTYSEYVRFLFGKYGRVKGN